MGVDRTIAALSVWAGVVVAAGVMIPRTAESEVLRERAGRVGVAEFERTMACHSNAMRAVGVVARYATGVPWTNYVPGTGDLVTVTNWDGTREKVWDETVPIGRHEQFRRLHWAAARLLATATKWTSNAIPTTFGTAFADPSDADWQHDLGGDRDRNPYFAEETNADFWQWLTEPRMLPRDLFPLSPLRRADGDLLFPIATDGYFHVASIYLASNGTITKAPHYANRGIRDLVLSGTPVLRRTGSGVINATGLWAAIDTGGFYRVQGTTNFALGAAWGTMPEGLIDLAGVRVAGSPPARGSTYNIEYTNTPVFGDLDATRPMTWADWAAWSQALAAVASAAVVVDRIDMSGTAISGAGALRATGTVGSNHPTMFASDTFAPDAGFATNPCTTGAWARTIRAKDTPYYIGLRRHWELSRPIAVATNTEYYEGHWYSPDGEVVTAAVDRVEYSETQFDRLLYQISAYAEPIAFSLPPDTVAAITSTVPEEIWGAWTCRVRVAWYEIPLDDWCNTNTYGQWMVRAGWTNPAHDLDYLIPAVQPGMALASSEGVFAPYTYPFTNEPVDERVLAFGLCSNATYSLTNAGATWLSSDFEEIPGTDTEPVWYRDAHLYDDSGNEIWTTPVEYVAGAEDTTTNVYCLRARAVLECPFPVP